METLRFVAERGKERFEIIESSEDGFYVFRFVDGVSTHDYLQDDLETARICAEEEFGVSALAWREALPGELPFGGQSL